MDSKEKHRMFPARRIIQLHIEIQMEKLRFYIYLFKHIFEQLMLSLLKLGHCNYSEIKLYYLNGTICPLLRFFCIIFHLSIQISIM